MSINLTENAAKEVKKAMEGQDNAEDLVLRVGVAGGGCSGLNYQLEFVNKSEIDPETDDQFEMHGVAGVIDKRAIPYLKGTTVDWHEDLNQRGFKFDNPNATGGCGCGTSFKCDVGGGEVGGCGSGGCG